MEDAEELEQDSHTVKESHREEESSETLFQEPESVHLEEVKNLKAEVERLQKALKEEQERSSLYLSQIQYLQADFENHRKMVRQEMDHTVKFGNEKIIRRLLDVRDDLERALKVAGDSKVSGSLLRGLEMVMMNLNDVLRQEGVAEIMSVGEVFDPARHEAVTFVDRVDCKDNLVTAEIRKGYTLHGKVVRASMVEVARNLKEVHCEDVAVSGKDE